MTEKGTAIDIIDGGMPQHDNGVTIEARRPRQRHATSIGLRKRCVVKSEQHNPHVAFFCKPEKVIAICT